MVVYYVRMRRSIVISALVVLIASCSFGPASSVRPSQAARTLPASTASLACQDAIASQDSPDSNLSVVFDQVALPTSNALQANRSSEPNGSTRLFAKIGLLIASGASFELVVPAEWVGHLMIGWGNPGIRTSRLHVSGCVANTTQKRWLVYAGGYWVDTPACVPLRVTAGGRDQLVQIGIGKACPGQSAPPPGT
jgi:hypothetical protein